MSITKPIHRMLLAALLLAGLFVFGSASSKTLYALHDLPAAGPDAAEKDHPTTNVQSPSYDLLYTGRPTALGNASGGGGVFAAGKVCFTFPAVFPELVDCSKSALKRRLTKLQEHFDYPQRLSLYPKHSFW